MKYAVCILFLAALIALACTNTSGLSSTPRATFSQIACLDANDDDRVNEGDAADTSDVPDFNGDRSRDEDDAAFLRGVDIPLNPQRDRAQCEDDKRTPEYLVAHDVLESSDVSCEEGKKAVLIVGVGGGVVNLREKEDAAGIRAIVDDLIETYEDQDAQTIAVVAGPAIGGAQEIHSAMEDWLTNATRVYLERYPCLKAVLVGHSHGAVTTDVVAARLEDQFANRMIAVVSLDRIDDLYTGDTGAVPQQVYRFNVFETNDPGLKGRPFDGANTENWDATAEQGPKDGEEGGPPQPVLHTTIDNSESVRERIVEAVTAREI